MRFFYLLVFLFFSCSAALAEQTIFNVPSADITPEDFLFIQHQSQINRWANNKYWLGSQSFAYGAGHHTELTATLYNLGDPATDNISMAFGFKSFIPILEDKYPHNKIGLTVGTEVPISVQGNGVGDWSYAHLSYVFPKQRIRLTSGVSFGTKQIYDTTTWSYIGGYEQQLTKRLNLLCEWTSGSGVSGLLIPGVSYIVRDNTVLSLGFAIPNSGHFDQDGIVFEYTQFLDLRPLHLRRKLHRHFF